jgi:hypothetical protein
MIGHIVDPNELVGHTPGPWSCEPQFSVITAEEGETICTLPGSEYDTRNDANAKLICMAPKLLAEVVGLRAELDKMQEHVRQTLKDGLRTATKLKDERDEARKQSAEMRELLDGVCKLIEAQTDTPHYWTDYDKARAYLNATPNPDRPTP